jgi:hypothetical protein
MSSSNEMFVQHPDGSRSDKSLHEPILAAGDAAQAKEVTRRRLRERGWTETDIANWLGDGIK